jgi:hypothetical protein
VKKYNVTRLVWYEEHPLYAAAIRRETSIKRWKRAWKLVLIEKMNPEWDDLLQFWNGGCHTPSPILSMAGSSPAMVKSKKMHKSVPRARCMSCASSALNLVN